MARALSRALEFYRGQLYSSAGWLTIIGTLLRSRLWEKMFSCVYYSLPSVSKTEDKLGIWRSRQGQDFSEWRSSSKLSCLPDAFNNVLLQSSDGRKYLQTIDLTKRRHQPCQVGAMFVFQTGTCSSEPLRWVASSTQQPKFKPRDFSQ